MNTDPYPHSAPDRQMVTASYDWNFEELVKVQRIRSRVWNRSPIGWLCNAYLVVASLVFVWMVREGFADVLTWGSVLLSVFLLLGRNRLKEWIYARQWQQVTQAGERTFGFAPTGLWVEGRADMYELEWGRFTSIVETPQGFILYPRPRRFHWVPSSAFKSATDLDRARRYIQASGARLRHINA